MGMRKVVEPFEFSKYQRCVAAKYVQGYSIFCKEILLVSYSLFENIVEGVTIQMVLLFIRFGLFEDQERVQESIVLC